MKQNFKILASFLVLVLTMNISLAQSVKYVSPKPLKSVINQSLQPVKSGVLTIPMITWGGDIATIYTQSSGLFKQNGLTVKLDKEDNFKKQVTNCLAGKTPYLRGTMGMINSAADVFKAKGTELVVIYQLTWSTGGDAMVVRSGKNLGNIKTLALQLYGPHMDYAANLFRNKNRLGQVSFKWLEDLTLPENGGSSITDPVSAFQSDRSLDATMCIIPDALMLTSNGNVGTGSEGSVKGSKILLSTKTAGRIIADVYAVRKDYFEKNKSKVEAFIKALMKGTNKLEKLSKSSSEFKNLLSNSADVFFGAPQATADAQALLGDCKFVGFSGNESFFTGKGTLRNFNTLNREIQGSFTKLGLLSASVAPQKATWNYASIGSSLGLSSSTVIKRKFDAQKVASKIEEKIAVEPTSWEEEGTLFVVEFTFEPNQSEFSKDKYANDFKKALEIAQTFSGALIVIEGHSDPLGILKAEKANKPKQIINAQKQQAKNLSLQRSQNVRKNFISYCKSRGIRVDDSQFLAVGMGTSTPKYSPPRTKEEWNANRRVVFRIKQVEAEMDEFIPLD